MDQQSRDGPITVETSASTRLFPGLTKQAILRYGGVALDQLDRSPDGFGRFQ